MDDRLQPRTRRSAQLKHQALLQRTTRQRTQAPLGRRQASPRSVRSTTSRSKIRRKRNQARLLALSRPPHRRERETGTRDGCSRDTRRMHQLRLGRNALKRFPRSRVPTITFGGGAWYQSGRPRQETTVEKPNRLLQDEQKGGRVEAGSGTALRQPPTTVAKLT